MPTNRNSNGSRTLLPWTAIPWVYTIGVIALSVWAVLSNPNMLFGESESAIGLALVELPIYPGQVTALQLLGTFAIALGLLSRMNERQHINRVSISAIGGALLIMAGLLLQQLQENPLLLVGLIGMAFYIILIWGIAAAAQAAYLLWQKAKNHRSP